MNIFEELISNLKRIKPETILMRSITTEALDAAVDLNRSQLEQGELSGGSVMPNYSKATEARNNLRTTKVSKSESIKFKDTGKFYDSIKAKVNKNAQLELKSNLSKSKRIQEFIEDRFRTDEKALGLQPENLKLWYEQFVAPNFQKMLIDRIKGQ